MSRPGGTGQHALILAIACLAFSIHSAGASTSRRNTARAPAEETATAADGRAVVPPIDAAARRSPLPPPAELAMLLGNQVRDLLRERQTEYDALPSTSTRHARAIAAEIETLQNRIDNGPNLQLLVDGITLQVVKLRDLEALRAVEFDVLERPAMQAFINEKLEEDMPPQGLRRSELLLKAVGAMQPRINLRRVLVRMIGEQAAGLYDPATKKLHIASTFSLDRPIARIILAHEICHALQDQHFDLRTMIRKVMDDDDRAIATLSVIEGDATQLMAEYAIEHLGGASILDYGEILFQDQRAYNAAPYFLRQSLVFPYIAGQQFLASAMFRPDGGQDELFRKPPVSTEQVIHPEKYFDDDLRDVPSVVPPLTLQDDRVSTVAQNTLGQFGVRTLLELWREPAAATVAEGWDGDHAQVWTAHDSAETSAIEERDALENAGLGLTWFSAWDSAADAEAFARTIHAVQQRGPLADDLGPRTSRPVFRSEAKIAGNGEDASRPDALILTARNERVSLRTVQKGRTVAVVIARGPAAPALRAFDDEAILRHLDLIEPGD